MNLNVRGYFLLSQYIAKQSMIPNQYGKIINIASIQGTFNSAPCPLCVAFASPLPRPILTTLFYLSGLGGNPPGHNTIAYNTSKGAVISFTKTLAAEWGKHNINVNR
jgi:NAD(P)-dependent dehydrogenase (short-subunit alcohol dehydrogenase family)